MQFITSTRSSAPGMLVSGRAMLPIAIECRASASACGRAELSPAFFGPPVFGSCSDRCTLAGIDALVIGSSRPHTVDFNFVVVVNHATLGRPTIQPELNRALGIPQNSRMKIGRKKPPAC